MPGMMDTVLNLGLNDKTVDGLAAASGDERFAWDSYRRFVQMYGDVVMGLKPEAAKEEDPFEVIIDSKKQALGIRNDIELSASDLRELVDEFKKLIKRRCGKAFPTDPEAQLWGAIGAVFQSWDNERARVYRRLNSIPSHWGTAVNVQSMVFGNLGATSATGVAFTRNPATGERRFYGEFLVNAQGEDVVAGTRTPQQISVQASREWAKENGITEARRSKDFPSLEEVMPRCYAELLRAAAKLEKHYKDMQDLEFTIENGRLWMLQTRNGDRRRHGRRATRRQENRRQACRTGTGRSAAASAHRRQSCQDAAHTRPRRFARRRSGNGRVLGRRRRRGGPCRPQGSARADRYLARRHLGYGRGARDPDSHRGPHLARRRRRARHGQVLRRRRRRHPHRLRQRAHAGR
jgi:hypothetical protein